MITGGTNGIALFRAWYELDDKKWVYKPVGE